MRRSWPSVLAAFVVGVACVACAATNDPPAEVDAGHHPNEGRPVGSPCTADLDCDSPTSPECLSEIKPLAALAGVPAELAALGLTFPSGYCSSTLNCSSDADCGAKGQCYLPFRDVTPETLRELETPLGVSMGTLDFLPAYGLCLRGCAAASECEVGQLCQAPMTNFISLVPGSINDKTYCVPDPACPPEGCTAGPCSPNPCQNAGTCAVNGSSYTCTCTDGFEGTNCETQTTVPDRVIGQSCTSDAQCMIRGTPRCLKEIHPLQAVLPATEFLATVGLDFAHGYCSNEPNCASNIECGPHGRCMAPFRNVTDQTFRDLEGTFDPPLAAGTLDFLGGYGVCLRSCTDSFECFPDQACQLVMDDFISQVPGSVNTQAFCVPQDDCKFCNSHAHCEVDEQEHGTCVCNPGFTGNGLTCASTGNGACASDPCANGGTCADGADNTYTCTCAGGYSGTNCQIAAACTPNPCHNAGTCAPLSADTFECSCPAGYSGPTCDTVTMCPNLSAPANGNLSVSTYLPGGSAQYECDTGFVLNGNATRTCGGNGQWSGSTPTCVAVTNPCSSAPCQHGGVCTPGSGSSFTCSCTGTGYSGTTCNTPVDCGSLGTIANGSIATSPPGSTTFGTTATYACNANFTLNGNASRTCQASGAWSGAAPTCVANTSNPCMPNPCLNSGTCTAGAGSSYTCACVNGFTGNNCQTPFDCGSLSAPANGTVTAATTTFGSTATYACNANFTLNGSATRTCASSGWSGNAPTCVASSCGMFTDVIYRVTATFAIKGTTFGIGNQTFTGLTNNATTPPFASSTNTTPFTGSESSGTFTRGFVRLRFTNNASGTPIAGTVRLVEWYVPLEFTQTAGATLYANNDHSVGILANPGSLSNCGGGDATCTSHTPTVSRTCAANASGTLNGTTLSWGACSPAATGANSWSYASSARSATGAGCASHYVQYGNNTTSSGLVPASGKGDAYQVYGQQLTNIVFSGTNYLTATWTMGEMQIPNGTGQSNTWLSITSATPIGTDCGTTAGTDLVCNVQ
jgi:Notch-like protein